MNLIEAVIHNNRLEVEQCLTAGTDPNACQDAANVTPLHFAAQHNATDVISLLIAAGANIYARTVPDGQTPLEVAKLNGHEEMVALLQTYIQKLPYKEDLDD